MEALWLMGNPGRCFRVPDQQIIIDKQGELFSSAPPFEVPATSLDDFMGLCASADIIVLVAGGKQLDSQWLAAIPPHLPKVGFLANNSHPEARLQLTMVGVDGYVSISMCQPDFEVVLQKIHEDKLAINGLQEELKNFSAIAFTAMSSASEMGTVAVFAEKVQGVMDLHRLAHLVLACLKDLRLEGVIQFMFEEDVTLFPADVSISYQKLLHSARVSAARIVSQGRFLLFSFDHIQLLVTDAPHLDQDRYGRLRDVLAHLVSIAEARAKTLKVNTLLKAQQDNTRMVMTLLEMAAADNRNSVKEIMTGLSNSLRVMATGFDLNMEQESELLSLSDRALNSLEGLQEATSAVEVHFRSLIQQLDTATNLLKSGESEQPVVEDSDSRVELF
ncbi:MAG: hypothetical protein AAGC78_12115 [Cellvibrio sp.]|uniref:hypothetical protein n=1 Tax=Cellvibrio sp. TaxID=1965322 RepID=UPI0031A7B507